MVVRSDGWNFCFCRDCVGGLEKSLFVWKLWIYCIDFFENEIRSLKFIDVQFLLIEI